MAGQAASRAVPFGSVYGPHGQTCHVIQINAAAARAPNDLAPLSGHPASLTAPEETQP